MRVLLATRGTGEISSKQVAKQFISGWKSVSSEDSFFSQIFSDDFKDPDHSVFWQAKGVEVWQTPSLGENSFSVIATWGEKIAFSKELRQTSDLRRRILIEQIDPCLIPGYPKLDKDQIEKLFLQLLFAPLVFLNAIYQADSGQPSSLDLHRLEVNVKAFLRGESANTQVQIQEYWQLVNEFMSLCRPSINRVINSNISILLEDNSDGIDLLELWSVVKQYPGAEKALSIYEKTYRLLSGKELKKQLPIIGQTDTKTLIGVNSKEISGWGIARLLAELGLEVSTLKTEICEEINSLLGTENAPDLIVCFVQSLGIWDYPNSLLEKIVKLAGRYGIPVVLWGDDLDFTRRDVVEMGFAGIYKLPPGTERFIAAGLRTAVTWTPKPFAKQDF